MIHWKRNLVVLCAVQSLSMMAFSAYFPLVPFYMQELGAESYAEAMSWMAIYSAGSALAMMVSGTIWGSVGDRYGRKLMLGRATLAGSLTMFASCLVRSPTQLVAVRIVMGFLGGTVAASTTLVATETPEQHLGSSLGVLQTVQVAGSALGPLVGGVIADALGLRGVLAVSSATTFVAFIIVVVLVRERASLRPARCRRLSFASGRGMLAGVMSHDIMVMLGVVAVMSVGINLLSPVLSLYIKSLSPHSQHLATLVGAVSSATAFTSALAALVIGRLGDRFGTKRVLVACGLGVALVYVPQALITTPMQLLVLRAIQGIFAGGITPTAMALLARSTRPSRRGTVFGLATSARAGGRAIGPLLGAASANAWGMASVFLVAAGVYGIMATMVGARVRGAAESAPAAKEEDARTVASP